MLISHACHAGVGSVDIPTWWMRKLRLGKIAGLAQAHTVLTVGPGLEA